MASKEARQIHWTWSGGPVSGTTHQKETEKNPGRDREGLRMQRKESLFPNKTLVGVTREGGNQRFAPAHEEKRRGDFGVRRGERRGSQGKKKVCISKLKRDKKKHPEGKADIQREGELRA